PAGRDAARRLRGRRRGRGPGGGGGGAAPCGRGRLHPHRHPARRARGLMSGAEVLVPARFAAVIGGGGPRGGATVLRSVARGVAAGTAPVRPAIIDAPAAGPGATWLMDQPAPYLNHAQADATTVHPDDSTPMTGPAAPGPDLVDWARRVRADGGHPAGAWVLE